MAADRIGSNSLRRTSRVFVVLMLACSFAGGFTPAIGFAEATGQDGATSTATPPDFAVLRTEAQQNARRLQASAVAEPHPSESLLSELGLWEELDLVIAQRQLVQENLAAVAESIDRGSESFDTVASPPKNFLELDELRDQSISLARRIETMRLELQSERSLLDLAKDRFQESEKLRRRSAEALESADPSGRVALKRRHALLVLHGNVLAHRLELQRDQIELRRQQIDQTESRLAGMNEIVADCIGKLPLTQEELDERLAMIETLESSLRGELAQAKRRMRQSLQSRGLGEGSSADRPTDHNIAYEVAHEELQLFQKTLSEVSTVKECWRRRMRLGHGDASAQEIAEWLAETEQAKERISHLTETIRLRSAQRQEELASLGRAELIENNGDVVVQASGERHGDDGDTRRAELDRIINVYAGIHSLASGSERMYGRFIADLEARESRFSISEWWQLAVNGISKAWEYEIATIDDRPITIRKIAAVLLMLMIGYFVSRSVASLVSSRILPRFGLSPSGAAVIRNLLFYPMLIVIGIVSLDIVNVPLTVFAFLGGAVAIGVGFGSQNLVNNFISGLILLVERPIRIGDLVNVEGIEANVTNIGARSTRVCTSENQEILVPNSKFLENNVTNWTLSNTRIRTRVSVGVAYGSPVRSVIEHLNRVTEEHPLIIKSPEPIVLFKDFGDSALLFEAHFWIHMKKMMDGALVRSEIRVAIDDAFREAGIVIAFPQRDVHIDMQSPVEVRLQQPQDLSLFRGRPRAAG